MEMKYVFCLAVLRVQAVPIPAAVLRIPGRNSSALYEIVFRAVVLRGLSFTKFRVTRKNDVPVSEFVTPVKNKNDDDFWVMNGKGLGVLIDGQTGLVKRMRKGLEDIALVQNFFYYPGMSGNNSKFEFRASGAYIFRPNGSEPLSIGSPSKFTVFKGRWSYLF
jgi:lysosomal alpha-mannosidase